MYFDQSQFDLRCEWGLDGVRHLAPSDVLIIVDVLSFTTCVDIAINRGAVVFPFNGTSEQSISYAREQNAQLAGPRNQSVGAYSLSPASLRGIPAGTRIVLPSPNGSRIAFEAASSAAMVLAGCLRNASAAAKCATHAGKRITVVPAGERWPNDTLRPAVEDLIGAGAILAQLPGSASPEAQLAIAAYKHFACDLRQQLMLCASGRELIERGFKEDVELATELNVSATVPVLKRKKFSSASAAFPT